MKPEQQRVAGLWCGEVLEHLSDYVDGSVSAELQAKIEEHLGGCSWCERFGGQFQAMVAKLKAGLAEPEPVPDDVADRLHERLRRGFESDGR